MTRCSRTKIPRDGLVSQLKNAKSQLRKKDNDLEQLNDEIRSLRNHCQSYENEMKASGSQSQLSKTRLEEIGIQVRMRFLDHYQKTRKKGRMPRDIIKEGDRAAHRGRPLEDLSLYEIKRRSDVETYRDLYGIPIEKLIEWANIQEVVDICGFHGSLQSSNSMTQEFKALFSNICDIGEMCGTAVHFQRAFKNDGHLKSNYDKLQMCFDDISPKLKNRKLHQAL